MEITYDQSKNAKNIKERCLSFEEVIEFDFETDKFSVDLRKHYGEQREIALGLLNDRVHVLIFIRTEKGLRVVSFRKANKREIGEYAQED